MASASTVWLLPVILLPFISKGIHELSVPLLTLIGIHTEDGRYDLWLNVAIATGLAVTYLVASPLPFDFAFHPAWAVLLFIGGGLYRMDTAVWSRWKGRDPERDIAAPAVIAPTLFAPIPEEILFRGVLAVVIDISGVTGYILLSSVLFGFNHATAGGEEVVLKTANGVAYGLAFVLAGTIVAPILLHFGYNLASFYSLSDFTASVR